MGVRCALPNADDRRCAQASILTAPSLQRFALHCAHRCTVALHAQRFVVVAQDLSGAPSAGYGPVCSRTWYTIHACSCVSSKAASRSRERRSSIVARFNRVPKAVREPVRIGTCDTKARKCAWQSIRLARCSAHKQNGGPARQIQRQRLPSNKLLIICGCG